MQDQTLFSDLKFRLSYGRTGNQEGLGDFSSPALFSGGQNYNEEIFAPATEQQNNDWSWWPITQQSFNILADGFRRKATGGTLVDAVVEGEDTIVEAFRNKGLTIRKASS